MGLRKILTDKDPALHKVCRPVEKFDWRLHKLLDDMTDTLAEANGVGLAAPQVGILRRVVVVDTGDGILELVNPTLIETDGEQIGAEGCLSVPGKYGLVKRPYYAKVRAQDRNGEWFEAEGGRRLKNSPSLPGGRSPTRQSPCWWCMPQKSEEWHLISHNSEEYLCELYLWERRTSRRPA